MIETLIPRRPVPPGSRLRRLAILAVLPALTACASGGQRSLREGMLREGIGQKAVLTEWGLPGRTLSIVSEGQLGRRWGGQAPALAFRDRRPLDLWVYDRHRTELVFDGGDLVAWRTALGRDQLRAIPTPQTSAQPYPARDGRQALDLGLLRVDIGRKAFRVEWGEPDRVVPVAASEDLEARWGSEVRGSVLAGKRDFEIWFYPGRGVELLFQDGDLMAWRTEKTVEELRPRPSR